MNENLNHIFTIACDMDDVLMVPHSYVEFARYLGISKQLSPPLNDYKMGKISYESLWKAWHAVVSELSVRNREAAIIHTANTISKSTFEFVEKCKKLGRFIIVSNNDRDLVESIAGRLGVEYFAVNKFIFEFSFNTNRKSEIIKKQNINVDVVVTDDPVNEEDFLSMTSNGIVFQGKRQSESHTSIIKSKNYLTADGLDEVYEIITKVKKRLSTK